MANAVASNQRTSVRWPEGGLPLAMRSGNPPEVFVLDGFVPENPGEKYTPEANVEMVCRFQPPSTRSTTAGALERRRRPLPTGTAQVVLATMYCRRSTLSRCQRLVTSYGFSVML